MYFKKYEFLNNGKWTNSVTS